MYRIFFSLGVSLVSRCLPRHAVQLGACFSLLRRLKDTVLTSLQRILTKTLGDRRPVHFLAGSCRVSYPACSCLVCHEGNVRYFVCASLSLCARGAGVPSAGALFCLAEKPVHSTSSFISSVKRVQWHKLQARPPLEPDQSKTH